MTPTQSPSQPLTPGGPLHSPRGDGPEDPVPGSPETDPGEPTPAENDPVKKI